ncbi:MAG: tocopherol cyclase family protein, partial [Solirubrobacteraceae bacterium]
AHPGRFWRQGVLMDAQARSDGPGARAGSLFFGDDQRIVVDLAPDARLDVTLSDLRRWPRTRPFGGSSWFQMVPGLNQYWHPWLLGGRAAGTATIGRETWRLSDAQAYAEKNWGSDGFPTTWWWGQAHGFAREDVCVAFAGGRAGLGRLHVPAGALVARVGDRVVTAVRPPRPVRIDVGASGWRLRGGGIEIEGEAAGAEPHLLPVPVPLERRRIDGRAAQLLAGTVRLRVARRGRVTFAGESRLAGLELGRGHQATPREL